MSYERHEDMVAPARERTEPWRLAVGIGGSIAIFFVAAAILLTSVVSAFGPVEGKLIVEGITEGGNVISAVLALLFAACVGIGPLILTRTLHDQSPLTLFGPLNRAFLDFALSVRALAILYAILWFLPSDGPDPVRAMGTGAWLALLPVTLIAILIQVTGEEIAFRGYLQSQLAARWASPLVWMVLPAAFFAIGHLPAEAPGTTGLLIVAIAFVFSLAAADLTARTGTLGAAVGLHFAGNVIGIALVSFKGPVDSLSLMTLPYSAADVSQADLVAQLGVTFLSWLAIRVALRV